MNDVAAEMPRYRCHKEVHALKIAAFEKANFDGSKILVPVEEGYAPFRVPFEYMTKHNPQPGGYYVLYKDGYTSYSPAEPFEEGYTRIPGRY